MLKKAITGVLRLLGLQVRRRELGWWFGPFLSSTPNEAALFGRRFGWADVNATFLHMRERWPHHQIVLLSDLVPHAKTLPIATVHCGCEPVDALRKFAPQQTVFLYACDSDAIGLPYVRQIIDHGGTFFPVQVYTPARFSNIDELARCAIETEYARQTAEGFQKFDFGVGDSLNLIQAIAVTSHLGGAYVEVGCFRGSSACVALAYMRKRIIRRECFFLDVFDGFVYQAALESADAMWSGSHGTEGVDAVRQRIAASAAPAAGLNANVLKCNIIEQLLPEEIGDIVVANIDVDLYEAVLAALLKVAPRMVVGGIIVVEDPGHTPALIGSRLALQEFLALPAAAPFLSVYLESGQTFLICTGGERGVPDAPVA
jgi:hypothetical protein